MKNDATSLPSSGSPPPVMMLPSPSPRLIFWTAAVMLPFAALSTTLPRAQTLSWAAMGAFVLLAVVDLALAARRLEGVTVEADELVRLARERDGSIPLRIGGVRRKVERLRVALLLPDSFRSEQAFIDTAIPEADQSFSLPWPCVPSRRGRFDLRWGGVESPSPIGFWQARKRFAFRTELRVYPDLRKERQRVAAQFLRKGDVGIHNWRQVGKGREFEKLREYQPGDSYEDIHWKATAKRRFPVTKMFQIERTQEVYVLIDASRLSARIDRSDSEEPGGLTYLDRFVTAALMLGFAAEKQGDLFGLLAFDRTVGLLMKAGHGKAHYQACRDALFALHPAPVTPDFNELFTLARSRLRKRALLILLTHLDDPLLAENFLKGVELICRRHLVVVNLLRPPDARPLFSDDRVATTDDLYRRLGGHELWRRLNELGRELSRRGVRLEQMECEKLSAGLISQYMSIKQKQLI